MEQRKPGPVHSWLGGLGLMPPEGSEPHQAPSDSNQRDSFDVNSGSTSRNTQGFTTTELPSPMNPNVTETQLRYRAIRRRATEDQMLQLHPIRVPELQLKDIPDLCTAVEEILWHITNNPDENCYPYIDEISFRLDKVRSSLGYPVVNQQYFKADLEQCVAGNEPGLQQTIMLHIINRHWLDKNLFAWKIDGQWSQPKDTRLPSREDDDISQPKPNLALGFTLKSFTGEDDSAPIPEDLGKCMSPDGGSGCFPFLFFEATGPTSDLHAASLANLHSASQALYNIYCWMIRADHEDTFFTKVRLFSIVLNAKDLIARAHRGKKDATGSLSFHFDEFRVLRGYTADIAHSLVRAILTEYAEHKLHTVLKPTFDQIVSQEDKRVVASKRRPWVERLPRNEVDESSAS